MKRAFLTGLLLWLPIGAVVVVIRFVFNLFDNSLSFLPLAYQPSNWLGFNIPGLGVILTLFAVWLTGVLATNFIGGHLVKWWEKCLNKIPLIRTVYSTVKQLLSAFIKPKSTSFRQVVRLEYPRKGCYSIGFLTADDCHFLSTEQELVSVFIPTTPNPTSGFLVYVPKNEVSVLNLSIENAFRLIVSLGVAHPPTDSSSPVKESLS